MGVSRGFFTFWCGALFGGLVGWVIGRWWSKPDRELRNIEIETKRRLVDVEVEFRKAELEAMKKGLHPPYSLHQLPK
jgi:membrane protein YqaA with SNARE-associated domain